MYTPWWNINAVYIKISGHYRIKDRRPMGFNYLLFEWQSVPTLMQIVPNGRKTLVFWSNKFIALASNICRLMSLDYLNCGVKKIVKRRQVDDHCFGWLTNFSFIALLVKATFGSSPLFFAKPLPVRMLGSCQQHNWCQNDISKAKGANLPSNKNV